MDMVNMNGWWVIYNRHCSVTEDRHPVYCNYYLYTCSKSNTNFSFGPMDDFGNIVDFSDK